jgi:hypothetical protein
MRKFILYASMAFVLSFYAVENIEAGLIGKIKKIIKAEPTDPCAGGAVACTYVFTARSGSDKQITMARRPVVEHNHDSNIDYDSHSDEYRSTDWYYYDLPFYTKSQVQAGYYIDENNKLVLMVAYSADKEGKSGAIVSRYSEDYGETWSESIHVTNNQHKFGLAVAPNSSFTAIFNDEEIKLREFTFLHGTTNGTIEDKIWHYHSDNNKAFSPGPLASTGLSVIYSDTLSVPLISVAYVEYNREKSWSAIRRREYKVVGNEDNRSWLSREEIPDCLRHVDDTAWLYDDDEDKFLLATKGRIDGNMSIGIHSTDDLRNYEGFVAWLDKGDSYNVSGIWKCPDSAITYILIIDNEEIWGLVENGGTTLLYVSNQNSSLQRRVSMFNVPAK